MIGPFLTSLGCPKVLGKTHTQTQTQTRIVSSTEVENRVRSLLGYTVRK